MHLRGWKRNSCLASFVASFVTSFVIDKILLALQYGGKLSQRMGLFRT